jgi:hypothetical protein
MSWIEVKRGPKLSKELYYLEDDIIESLLASKSDGCIFDYVGHSAIENYFGNIPLTAAHCESVLKVPPEIAKKINAGNMNKMLRAWAGGGSGTLKYDAKGYLIEVNGFPFKEIKSTCGVQYNPKTNIHAFEKGDLIVLGAHQFQNDLTSDVIRTGIVKCALFYGDDPQNHIESCSSGASSTRQNWAKGYMDKYVGAVIRYPGRSDDQVDHYGMPCFRKFGWSWHLGACRKATPEEAAKALAEGLFEDTEKGKALSYS